MRLVYGSAKPAWLGPGDSLYYNSVVPHNLSAAGDGPASIYAVLYFPE